MTTLRQRCKSVGISETFLAKSSGISKCVISEKSMPNGAGLERATRDWMKVPAHNGRWSESY